MRTAKSTMTRATLRLFSRPRARAMLFALLAGGWGLRCIVSRCDGQAAGNVGRTQPRGDAQTQVDEAALLAGQRHGANDEKHGIAFETVDEVHDGGVVAADAGVERNLGEAGAGLALRVLRAGKADARGNLQFENAHVNGGVVGRDAFLVEVVQLLAGFRYALVEAAQRGGLN